MDETATAGPGPASDAATTSPSWWPAVLTVVAMASWPFLTLLASNPGVPIEMAVVRGWWLRMLVPSLVVLLAAMLVGRRLGRWVGGMLGVLLWLLWSLQTTSALRDAVGVTMADGWWWAVVAGVVLAASAVLMRHVVVQQFVAVVAVGLALSAAVPLAANATSGQAEEPVGTETAGDEPDAVEAPGDGGFVRTNDVWFLVLDGLAGNDLLRERGYDATAFEQALEADGFAIQHEATSNYPLTNLSISATVTMDYEYTGFAEPTEGDFFLHMSGSNAWVDLVRANGYSYAHAFPGFYIGSRCVGFEDVCVGDDTADSAVTETDTALATMTPLRRWVLAKSRQADIAVANDPSEQVRRILEADLPSPSHHFVHSLSPHPPILRDADCGVREVRLSLADWGEGPEYVDAVRCLHGQLADAADLILAHDPDAIVVIQGDHGPRLGIDIDAEGGVTLEGDMFFTIFSAVHLPEACDDIEVPQDLTPVNTFRIVRACLEDREPDLLENRRFPIRREQD